MGGVDGCIDPRFLDLVTSWSGQLHAPAALPLVLIEKEVGWDPEQV
jgi:hypothetical protein